MRCFSGQLRSSLCLVDRLFKSCLCVVVMVMLLKTMRAFQQLLMKHRPKSFCVKMPDCRAYCPTPNQYPNQYASYRQPVRCAGRHSPTILAVGCFNAQHCIVQSTTKNTEKCQSSSCAESERVAVRSKGWFGDGRLRPICMTKSH